MTHDEIINNKVNLSGKSIGISFVAAVRLDPELIKAVKHLAVDADRSFASLISEGVEDLLKKYSKKSKN